ncbi:hypothetical protein [Acinetobacter baumannii]|uniref:hypothetical protein n=1 Tax=Acinetobacter baumannii TaxID=470 RepID=UPI0015DD0987|nr:hypothetical protein [Acinetobacter baumannii]BBR73851.1 hypothetical protein WP4W18E11_21670 [Acinetobacter baumannii]
MANSNHNDTVLSYDELGFIIGMKRVEKKVSTIDSNIEKIIGILTQSFEEQKAQFAQPQPKLTEFQKMLNAVNNRQALDFEDLLKDKANPITQSFVVADKLVKDFADVLDQSINDIKTVDKKQINKSNGRKPAIEINSHEDLSKIINPTVPERDERGRFVSNPNEPIREGVDPLAVSELRLLSSYPSLYDEDAVFLGNFDYAVRKKFMKRAQFISVWNETLQEQHFAITYRDINHLNLVVVAKNPAEQATLEQDICRYIGYCDNLYEGKVNVHEVVEKPIEVKIKGSLASVHNTDMVKTQIKELLVERYGRESLSSSRWLVNGFNTQEMGKLINDNIVAFQDRMSDFTIMLSNELNKPNEWVYVTKDSITVELERTADISGATWTL